MFLPNRDLASRATQRSAMEHCQLGLFGLEQTGVCCLLADVGWSCGRWGSAAGEVTDDRVSECQSEDCGCLDRNTHGSAIRRMMAL